MPESFTNPCSCVSAPGTVAPGIAPYVISLNNLFGLVTIAAGGGIAVESQGNSILISTNGTAGLGTVTSVNATSSNTNLVVTGGPVTTTGTFAFSLAGALNSISGLVTAADKMIYTTASNTYAVADLTALARTLLDDTTTAAMRSTIGVIIGTNVQAWSATLDAYVANTTWSGNLLDMIDKEINILDTDGSTVGSGIFTASTSSAAFTSTFFQADNLDTSDQFFVAADCSISTTGSVTAASFSGDGSALTNGNASFITSGTLAVARGGTNIGSYAIGDLLYASGATTLSALADVAAGSFLRSGGVATAPAWSATLWPNTLATGDLLYASSTTQVSRLADVATGNALISGGVGVAPAWGKITTSHTTGIAASGVNSDITSFFNPITFSDIATFSGTEFSSFIEDNLSSSGNANEVLTAGPAGGTVQWSNQLNISTLILNTNFGIEGTITGAGTTGAQTINKPCGTVRFAAGATSLVVTNNLCTTSHRVLAMACTNDTTATVKNVVTTGGAFTITLEAAATAETEVYWELREIT
jgi:hypothetical protein